MLRIEALTLDFGARSILSGVTLNVSPPGMTVLLGPNGAGKSSLLRVVSGEIRPSEGSVQILGRSLPSWDRTQLACRRAMLPQSETLSFAFTVLEVVLLGRIPHGTSPSRDQRIAETALAEVGLTGFEDRSYVALSGGERKRVQLARVLAQIWPGEAGHVLLLDEPTAALDLVHQHRILALADRMSEKGVAVMVVLHDLNLAAQYANRVALMNEGRLVAVGSPFEVFRSSVLEPVFGLPVEVRELNSPNQRVVLAGFGRHEDRA